MSSSRTSRLHRCLWGLCMLLALGLVAPVRASPLRVGILIYRPLAEEQARWAPFGAYLQQALPDAEVELALLDYPALNQAVQARALDVVLTHPGHYLLLQRRFGLSLPIATLAVREQGQVLAGFGGVALAPARAGAPQTLTQLAGKRVAIVSKESLGGWQMQAYALLQRGIAPDAVHWVETGMPHDRTLTAVRRGEADAAFVRTGVFEALVRAGQLNPADWRVLDPQPLGAYPYASSTPLYPEWPVVTLPNVPPTERARLTSALLALGPTQSLAERLHVGFVPPADYGSVERVLKALGLPPFERAPVPFVMVLRQYWWQMALILAGLLLLAGLALRSHRLARRLDKALTIEQAQRQELDVLARTFDTRYGVVICDAAGRIERVNAAFTEMTGYSPEEARGKTPGELLYSGRQDAGFYQAMWQALMETGHWEGELWNRRKDGRLYVEQLSIDTVRDAEGAVRHYVGIFNDISDLRQALARIEHLAFYDPLTGLPNRTLGLDRLRQAIARRQRQDDWGAVLFIDLDHFKEVNDTLGHEVGDGVLVEMANRMRPELRDSDTLARLGGDEFLLVLENLGAEHEIAAYEAEVVARRLLAAIEQPLVLEEKTVALSASIGITLFDAGKAASAEALLKEADIAMYAVKQSGRSGTRFFDADMGVAIQDRVQLQRDLAAAIEADALQLFVQPQMNADGVLAAVELLLRWRHPERGFISPAVFIPLAEEHPRLMLKLGAWVDRTVQALLKDWAQQEGLRALRIGLNVSARQLYDPAFLAGWQAFLQAHPQLAPQVEFEITESILMNDIDQAERVLDVLTGLGARLALDDFGTGYSSLAYLSRLPFDTLKIDQHFVRQMTDSSKDEAIIRAVVALARGLGLHSVAEGVETEAHFLRLQALGCQFFQGYLFARPMARQDFEQNVAAGRWNVATELRLACPDATQPNAVR